MPLWGGSVVPGGGTSAGGGVSSGVYYPMCLATLKCIFDDHPETNKKAPAGSAKGSISGSAKNPFIFQVRPKSCSVMMNSYNEADTWDLEFDAHLFPLSPEIIQTMAVEIHMFQSRQPGQKNTAYEGYTKGAQNEWVNDEGFVVTTLKNRVMSGLVDTANYHAGSDGRFFKLTGRDYSALLIDRQWIPGRSIPVGHSLKETVQKMVDDCDVNGIMKVRMVGLADDTQVHPPKTKQEERSITAGTVTVTKTGKLTDPPGGNGHSKLSKKGIPHHGGSSYFDVMYRLCVMHGFICFVDGTDLIITTPKTLYENVGRGIYMGMGTNISELEIDRKLGKEMIPKIVVVSYNASAKDPKDRFITGEWIGKPSKDDPHENEVLFSGIGTKRDESKFLVVNGITSKKRLDEIARLAYQNIARGQAKIRLKTKSLNDINGTDLLLARSADPLVINFDSLAKEDYKELSAKERLDKLLRLGYDYDVAVLIADNYNRLNVFNKVYYCKDIQFSWDISSGIEISISAITYINKENDT